MIGQRNRCYRSLCVRTSPFTAHGQTSRRNAKTFWTQAEDHSFYFVWSNRPIGQISVISNLWEQARSEFTSAIWNIQVVIDMYLSKMDTIKRNCHPAKITDNLIITTIGGCLIQAWHRRWARWVDPNQISSNL